MIQERRFVRVVYPDRFLLVVLDARHQDSLKLTTT
jgi:hypothetical protein